MRGQVHKIHGELMIVSENPFQLKPLPIFYKDLERIRSGRLTLNEGDVIEFETVDEFTHPKLFQEVGWGEGPACAKIIEK